MYSQLWFIALKGYTANSAEGREKKHQIIPEGIQEQTSKVLHHTVTEETQTARSGIHRLQHWDLQIENFKIAMLHRVKDVKEN